MKHSYCQTLCGKICNWWTSWPPSEFLNPTIKGMDICAVCAKKHKTHSEVAIEAACQSDSGKLHAYREVEVDR